MIELERVTTVLSFERQDRTGHTYSRTTAAWRSQRGTAQGGAGITAIVGGLLQLLLGVLRPAERSHVARWSVDAQALLGGAAAEVPLLRCNARAHAQLGTIRNILAHLNSTNSRQPNVRL